MGKGPHKQQGFALVTLLKPLSARPAAASPMQRQHAQQALPLRTHETHSVEVRGAEVGELPIQREAGSPSCHPRAPWRPNQGLRGGWREGAHGRGKGASAR